MSLLYPVRALNIYLSLAFIVVLASFFVVFPEAYLLGILVSFKFLLYPIEEKLTSEENLEEFS